MRSPGDGDRRRAAAAILGDAVAQELLAVESEGMPGLVGLASQPRISRGHRDGIVVAVNHRPIVSRALTYALEECYAGRLERGRHPIAVIDVRVDPELIDVNVHPAKREVRFRDEGSIFSTLQRAVRAALGGSEPYRYRPAPPPPMPAGREPVQQLALGATGGVSVAPTAAPPGSVLRPVGQVGAGYLVAEGPDGVVLIDQHAAHERVLYNRVLARLREGRAVSQPLLMPQAIDVEPGLVAAAVDHRDQLLQLGLELVEFGPRSLRIVAIPAELPAGRATDAVLEMLSALRGEGEGGLTKVAAALACHSAVRFGDAMEPVEQRRLLADLELAEESVTCPHGRPTRLLMEWQDLKRHFRRNY